MPGAGQAHANRTRAGGGGVDQEFMDTVGPEGLPGMAGIVIPDGVSPQGLSEILRSRLPPE